MKKKWIFIIAGLLFVIFVYFVANFCVGSLRYAEQYEFKINNLNLIKIVERFKKENKVFQPPKNYSEVDSADTYIPNFYNVYLYYYDQNSIVYFVIDKDNQDPNRSTINLVSINEDLKTPFYKRINKDFDRADNLRIKRKFENLF